MLSEEPVQYVGRFAPSPTGPLHLGSLATAVASYLEARANKGEWLLRIEDIDPPREQAGSTESILKTLDHYGFEWDREVIRQSRSNEEHIEAIQQLLDRGLAYPCDCSRRQLADCARGPLGPIYPGNCRSGCDSTDVAIRLRTEDGPVTFHDRLQGVVSQRLESESGDFVIRRRDGLIAYHLAVVVDDHLQGVTDIVRGVDLIDSTPRQLWVQRQLEYASPTYAHIPMITHPNGDKLSKLTGAPAISLSQPHKTLAQVLTLLRQEPPPWSAFSGLNDLWGWALGNWQIERNSGVTSIAVSA